jgi:PAS domain-containing protein
MNTPSTPKPPDAESILGAIETIDEIIEGEYEVDRMLGEIVDAFVDIFDCDRAFLRFIKASGALCAPIVCTRLDEAANPERVFEQDAFFRAIINTARDTQEVFVCGPNARGIPADSLASKQGVRSMMIAVIQPRLGPTWLMGIHDCDHARHFSHEPRLFTCLGVRIADAITRTVYTEHFDQGEARNRVLIGSTSEALLIIDVGTQRIVETNLHAERLFGWPPGQLLGATFGSLCPERQPDGQRSDLRITELLAQVGAGEARAFEWTHRKTTDELVRCGVNLVPLPNPERLLVRASIRALG